MSSGKTKPDWTGRIALLAMVPVLAGGLWSFAIASRAQSSNAAATNCRGFEAEAHKLLDSRDAAALSGPFAPGDRVHLAIDFAGPGHRWEFTGVLGKIKKADMTGAGRYRKRIRSERHIGIFGSSTPSHTAGLDIVTGSGRLNVEIEVAAAGDGAIKISKTGSAPSTT